MRLLWMGAGWLSFGAGAVGAVVPLLPTVPFMLLAAFCFARGSDRVHAWLIGHPQFGPAILDWQQHGAIRPKAKRMAVLAVGATFLVSVILGLSPEILMLQAIALSFVLLFVLSRPSGPRDGGIDGGR